MLSFREDSEKTTKLEVSLEMITLRVEELMAKSKTHEAKIGDVSFGLQEQKLLWTAQGEAIEEYETKIGDVSTGLLE